MDKQLLERKFALMGARVKIGLEARLSRRDARFTVEVLSDRKGVLRHPLAGKPAG